MAKYYSQNLESFGPGAKGVGWRSIEAQQNRFLQLSKIISNDTKSFNINDLGCGTGDFYIYLSENYPDFKYAGYDILAPMIRICHEKFNKHKNAVFFQIEPEAIPQKADYSVASGIFNLKYLVQEKIWINHILRVLKIMDETSSKGFAFNMLTSYSDNHLMQDHLYYADPLFFFDHCKRNFSKNVALLHDYDEYDFTLLVRK